MEAADSSASLSNDWRRFGLIQEQQQNFSSQPTGRYIHSLWDFGTLKVNTRENKENSSYSSIPEADSAPVTIPLDTLCHFTGLEEQINSYHSDLSDDVSRANKFSGSSNRVVTSSSHVLP
ncbi:unnamed protein product [Pleuronectes platessa]|uniref:Uncharacterized protein n=1 Tax=Pleuronectes platessa TaxID=8262 RepID=A0A9N7VKK5_PLEPL|nr:unnamed protein product [Pleuronectes platessa]